MALSFTIHKWKNYQEIHIKLVNSKDRERIFNKKNVISIAQEQFHFLPVETGTSKYGQRRGGTRFEDSSPVMDRKIFIHNVPLDWVNKDLSDMFSHYGEVAERYICFKKSTKKKKNIGFVIFRKKETAHFVCEVKTIKYKNAIIRVKWATSKEDIASQQQHRARNRGSEVPPHRRVPNRDKHNRRRNDYYLDREEERRDQSRAELLRRRRREYQRYSEYHRLKPTSSKYFQEQSYYRLLAGTSHNPPDNFRLNKMTN